MQSPLAYHAVPKLYVYSPNALLYTVYGWRLVHPGYMHDYGHFLPPRHCSDVTWGFSKHRELNSLFQLTSKKTSNPALLALCAVNPLMTEGLPSQRAGDWESNSITRCHHGNVVSSLSKFWKVIPAKSCSWQFCDKEIISEINADIGQGQISVCRLPALQMYYTNLFCANLVFIVTFIILCWEVFQLTLDARYLDKI